MSIEVYAPFKIFSLLIRGLDAEVKRRAEMGQGGNKLQDEFYGEDGRLDTVGDDDDYNWKEDGDDEDDDKIDVGDFNIQKGDDDYGYLEKKFNVRLVVIWVYILDWRWWWRKRFR